MSKKFDFNDCRKLILNHFEKPNFKVEKLTDFSGGKLVCTEKSNSCSDFFKINFLIVKEEIVKAQFAGTGCVLSTSSLDMLLANIVKKTVSQALEIVEKYLLLVEGKLIESQKNEFWGLICFQYILKQPNRFFCVVTGARAILKLLRELIN